jgi:hypothetical protein
MSHNYRKAEFGKPVSGSLSIIINHYKGALTRWCRKNDHAYFTWQSRFYDHIIRNDTALSRIREYIARNPLTWTTDQEQTDQVHESVVKYAGDAINDNE